MAEAMTEAGAEGLSDPEFVKSQKLEANSHVGSLHYHHVDVQKANFLNETIANIAERHQRIDGPVVAAVVQQIKPAIDYTAEEITRIMDRRLSSWQEALQWNAAQKGIRVNSLSPEHIVNPMVEKNFEEAPGLDKGWEQENMLGRLSRPEELTEATISMLSDASSFMTGTNIVID
ncbi:hypothetical protein PABG_04045 [Paracoccidioides brasiliensis Pb03]|nr:hypothetical protein PABG_04045 [Paracoccidioides brasiliensis Pb03]